VLIPGASRFLPVRPIQGQLIIAGLPPLAAVSVDSLPHRYAGAA
jgi:hypothetical protein